MVVHEVQTRILRMNKIRGSFLLQLSYNARIIITSDPDILFRLADYLDTFNVKIYEFKKHVTVIQLVCKESSTGQWVWKNTTCLCHVSSERCHESTDSTVCLCHVSSARCHEAAESTVCLCHVSSERCHESTDSTVCLCHVSSARCHVAAESTVCLCHVSSARCHVATDSTCWMMLVDSAMSLGKSIVPLALAKLWLLLCR